MNDLVNLASSGGGHRGVGFWLVPALIFLVALPLTFWRLRRGGPGPAMNWIPRSMRGKAHERYREHGWQEPFDDNGNRNPDRSEF